ncbi:MAG: alpha/beta fold hydrolase [Puniceicoccales bacterium]|jgi:haloalkane dehalogenase|nr:alpha/beta fold hydrolase [Puniceicoccales bacterium]
MEKSLPLFLREVYPFQQHYAKLKNGSIMHYVEEGTGETILFLHGHPTWSFFFRNLILLLRSDFKCIAIDHIGHGLSDKPKSCRYDIKTHIDNAISFAEIKQFKKFHIVAQDFGVAVALAIAERWPERISSMSLLNSAVFSLPRLPAIILLFKFPLFTFLCSRFFNLFAWACLHLGTFSILDGDVIRGYLWPYEKFSDRVAIAAEIDDIPWLPDHPSLKTLSIISEKAFILCNKKIKFFWSDDDFRYGFDVLKAWGKILPNAAYKRYQMAGHFLLEDSNEAMNDIRTFIYSARNIENLLFK